MERIKKDDMEEGQFEADVYTEEGAQELVDNDEIDASEAGFMEGYENTDLAYCDNCGKNITDAKEAIEEVINDKKHIFCCRACRDEYDKKHNA